MAIFTGLTVEIFLDMKASLISHLLCCTPWEEGVRFSHKKEGGPHSIF